MSELYIWGSKYRIYKVAKNHFDSSGHFVSFGHLDHLDDFDDFDDLDDFK